MTSPDIIPTILSGGSGTRLWPLSRASKPKQFLAFGGERSLYQETVLRCRGDGFDPRPIVVGANPHRFLLAEDLLAIGVEADILLEHVARNSCAAIAAACLQARARDTDALVLVLAADHHIPDAAAFRAAVLAAKPAAEAGRLVTFGIRPVRPATGYGYIRPGAPDGAAFAVDAFVEKPDAATAAGYVEAGYLWNSGNFLFRAASFLEELAGLAPEILEAVTAAHEAATADLDFRRLDEAAFARSPSISVDYAVMEKTSRAAVFPVSYRWSDVGSWDAVADVVETDGANAIVGDGLVLSGARNLVHSQGKLTALVGVDDCVVVSTRDCVLVASRKESERVKEIVSRLQRQGRAEAVEALQIFRPWGNYERLDIGKGYQVKRITVKPGGVLSLQKHRHRAEHWVVVSGAPEVTVDEAVRTYAANESVYIPLGSVHRLANRGAFPAVLIEVQTGDYLGEDDIIRLEDNYNRPETESPALAATDLQKART